MWIALFSIVFAAAIGLSVVAVLMDYDRDEAVQPDGLRLDRPAPTQFG